MLFNSIDFIVFLPIVFFLYWIVPSKHYRIQNIILLIISYIFYGWWDWRFLGLILLSSFADFFIGILLSKNHSENRNKFYLMLSLVINLGVLGFFKYYNFFISSISDSFSLLGFPIEIGALNIILPVGISFYTFQTLSYTIDIYKKKLEPTTDIVAFFTFVSFFPQLVAGPIERASHLLPQFNSARKFTSNNISRSFKYILWGFFLKLVVADRAGIYVDAVYNNVDMHGGLTFSMATILFAFQIYGDFSGYSLIAIGVAKMFDFHLMTNFMRPYLSKSVGEFWNRWHISLSTWFRDYLYIPLGGNRVKKSRWLLNLFITFVISGLWHGANWTFIVWGGLNGLYLIYEVLLNREKKRNVLNIGLTFLLINISWVFFRANNVSEALLILGRIFTQPGDFFIGSGEDVTALFYSVTSITILLIVEIRAEYFDRYVQEKRFSQYIELFKYAVLAFLILYLGVFNKSQFIYFQF